MKRLAIILILFLAPRVGAAATPPPDLNLVSLHEHMDAELKAIDKAMVLFRDNLEVRLEGMNQFRDDLRAQAAQFISRTEFQSANERLAQDITMLRESRALLEGKASQASVNALDNKFVISLVLAGLSLGVTVLSLISKGHPVRPEIKT